MRRILMTALACALLGAALFFLFCGAKRSMAAPNVGLKFQNCSPELDTRAFQAAYDTAMSHLTPEQVPGLTTVRCGTADLAEGQVRIIVGSTAEIYLTDRDPLQFASGAAWLAMHIRQEKETEHWAAEAHAAWLKSRSQESGVRSQNQDEEE